MAASGQVDDSEQMESRPSMTSSQVQRTGLPRTVLFVDISGSTKLYETLGNARAQAVIAKTLAIDVAERDDFDVMADQLGK